MLILCRKTAFPHRHSHSGRRSSCPAEPADCPCESGRGGGESRRRVRQLSDQRSQRLIAAQESHTASATAGQLQVSLV